MCVISYSARGKYFTLLASSFMFPISAFAQCVDTQDCQTLGYTETSNSGNCIKCFFGDYWFCLEPEEEKAVLGQCTGYAKNCKIGDILNNDGTCTNGKVSGKTPIAVVVYIGSDNCGQALALDVNADTYWSTKYEDVPTLPNHASADEVVKDFDSCGNTAKILAHESSYNYNAALSATTYAPPAVHAETIGKWCLMSAGVAQSINNNYQIVKNALQQAGGDALGTDYYLTSDEFDASRVWVYGFLMTEKLKTMSKDDKNVSAQYVIEF